MSYFKELKEEDLEKVSGGKQVFCVNGDTVDDPENDYCLDGFVAIPGMNFDPRDDSQRRCINCKFCELISGKYKCRNGRA